MRQREFYQCARGPTPARSKTGALRAPLLARSPSPARSKAGALTAPLLALALVATPAAAQKFYPDDPILVDRDDLPIDKPGVIELSATYDLLEKTFAPMDPAVEVPRAMNVNTLGEVPDSSWFRNRIGVREMTLEELARGPSVGGRPELPLTVIAGKATGISPGFTVRDAAGKVYFVKFDPLPHPNLSTAAEVIGKNFFYAIGYNVTESYLVYLRSGDLTIDPGAQVRIEGSKRIPMERAFLEKMLEESAHHPDGSTRAVASLALEGEALGPFQFQGTRPDDPNDIVPHEHRRELRGYRVFCAWLNHDDSRAINTLDTYVGGPGGSGHIRHHLIDFSSSLGSGSDYLRRIAPQDPRAGNEYIVDFEPIWKAFYTFGIADRAWRRIPYAYPRYAEAGRIESDYFDPATWKPEYPNPAFDRMLADDGFWAAKIVARFTDDAVRVIVSTGDFLSKDAERYLADTVIRRRDKVVAHYFRELNPLDGFSAGDSLEFRNQGVERGLGEVAGYEYEWFAFDNQTGELASLGASGRADDPRIPIPDSDSPYLMVRIRAESPSEPSWSKPVDVYLRAMKVVGIEREI
jgi:hypothetical protein